MLLVKNSNYNGREALFMFKQKDYNERVSMFGDDDYEVLGEGDFAKEKFIPKGYQFPAIGKLTIADSVYAVFNDYSVTKI